MRKDDVFSKEQLKLFKKNKKLLLKAFPAMEATINGVLPANVEVIQDDDTIDVLINGQAFYGADARIYAGQQIELFLKAPNLIDVFPNEPDEVRTPTHLKSLKEFDRLFKRRIKTASLERQRLDAATTFVFGIGLGFHLYSLLADTRCRELVIIEPEPMFLVLSMYFTDWTRIFKTLNSRVAIIFEKNPDYCFGAIRGHIHLRNPGVQQTIFYFRHYRSEYMDLLYKSFREKSHLFFDGLGFYDDEKVMTKNFLLNMYMGQWSVCAKKSAPISSMAVVVGAGPSLSKDIQWLKNNQDNIIIFSGGSALQPLLKNGITPDFHVEIENIALNYELLSPLAEEFDLSKTVLISSSTMDPASAQLFLRRVWFMREGVTATYLFSGGPEAMAWQNPTVVNTAMSAAMHIGFRNIILLGADFGTTNIEKHHVEETSYETHEDLKKVSFKFPDKTVGNFGGVAYTSAHYMNGVNCLKYLMDEFRGVKVLNCSDGAKVGKTIPIKSHRVDVPNIGFDKADFVTSLYEKSGKVDWIEIAGEGAFEVVKEDFSSYLIMIKGIVKEKYKKKKDFIIFLSDIFKEINKIEGEQSKYNPMITGSVVTETILMMYWWRRIYPGDLRKYENLCKVYIEKFIDVLEADFKNFVDSVRQELPLVRPELFDDKGTLISDKQAERDVC